MAIQTVELDPNAEANQTDDEIIAQINAAADPITREGALSQDDLNILKTNPITGEFKIKNLHRGSDGKIQIEYDDVAEP